MWVISFLGFGNSYDQLFVAAIASIILAVFAMFFTGDKKRQIKQKQKKKWPLLGLSNTLQVFKKKNVVIFAFFATLFRFSIANYQYIWGSILTRYGQSTLMLMTLSWLIILLFFLSISQISEVVFILFLPCY